MSRTIGIAPGVREHRSLNTPPQDRCIMISATADGLPLTCLSIAFEGRSRGQSAPKEPHLVRVLRVDAELLP
jgi:hypothetical protein